MPGLSRHPRAFFACACQNVEDRDKRAFTSVFDGPCPAMTEFCRPLNNGHG
jgi:hypothetical protein